MAKSKKSKPAAKVTPIERDASVVLDDIELLNYYKYPDFYPTNMKEKILANKNAQRRIEDLIRDNPVKKTVRSRSVTGRPVDFASLPESGGDQVSPITADPILTMQKEKKVPEEKGIKGAIRKWFP
jgi:hypothetical protein